LAAGGLAVESFILLSTTLAAGGLAVESCILS
jgi:hypothetical protein